MLQELALNNVLIKQLSGNTELLAAKGSDIIKMVWRVFKTNKTVNSYGFYSDSVSLTQSQQPSQNLLELEVYCLENYTVN